MLMSAGVPIPSTIFVHGYLTIDNQKISKSLGNVVDPVDLVGKYGADAVRYWLLREVPPTDDADYTQDKLERRYTADLANDLGNLLNRSVSMLHRYRKGIVPAVGTPSSEGEDLAQIASGIAGRVQASMGDDYDPRSALVAIWELVVRANRYVQESAPWTLAKAERAGDSEASDKLDTALYHLAETLRLVGEAVRPFLPDTAERIVSALGATGRDRGWLESLEWGAGGSGQAIAPAGKLLFPKIE
jgi:methionyl-tRNA synthetase